MIDTAYMYGNEREVGEAVRQSGIPRSEIFVITKLYPDQYDHAERAIEEALKKLDIGYIDMMLLHHPASNDVKAYTAIEEAIRDVSANTSTITCKLYLVNDWSLNISGRSDNTCTIDGSAQTFSSPAISTTGTHLLGTVSRTVNHASDGSND